MKTVLCLTNFFKGHRLLESFKELGCRTLLVGTTRVRHDPWPSSHVDERFFVHDFVDEAALLNAITYLARDREIDLVVPLEEYAVETAGKVRAHLGLPGPSEGITRRARDKLAMRLTARAAGIPVPAFSPFLNRNSLGRFLNSVPGPWMVKPRAEGGAIQIRKLQMAEEVWKLFDELGDRRSHHLIEAFVPGQVYHVDSVVHQGKVLMAVAGQYGTPPFDVWHGGGVFTSRTVPKKHRLRQALLDMNEQVITAVGVRQGVNHVEFLGLGDRVYFLEIGARVAGSNLDRLTTAATGIDLFLESARLEIDWIEGGYKLPKTFRKEAGIVLCLSRDKDPCPSFCHDHPEVVWTLNHDHHAGCVVASPSSTRIDQLVAGIKDNLIRDHLAVLPGADTPG
jgi:biotin carboxylase